MLCLSGLIAKIHRGSRLFARAALVIFCALSQTPLLPAASLWREAGAIDTEEESQERECTPCEAALCGESSHRLDRRRAKRWQKVSNTLSDVSRSCGGTRCAAPHFRRAIQRGDSLLLPLRC